METTAQNIIPSGIEPVDKLMGGLESGQLYLVHGESAGKSLFGIKFLIEGLKRGENGALVIRYSPEDAVRRFARLGYDCLEDVYSGRLVILEYSDDVIQQISRLRELAPVLRELEWLLGETRPHRLVIDPVTTLVASDEGNLQSRALEFADWSRSFGATVALVASGDDHEIVRSFTPLVAEVFRFEVRDIDDRATRFMVFEKSPVISDQPIEVDPSRGVFMLARAHEQFKAERMRSVIHSKQSREAEAVSNASSERSTAELSSPNKQQTVEDDLSGIPKSIATLPAAGESGEDKIAFEPVDFDSVAPDLFYGLDKPAAASQPEDGAAESPDAGNLNTMALVWQSKPRAAASTQASQSDDVTALIEELTVSPSPLDLDIPELEQAEERTRESAPETYSQSYTDADEAQPVSDSLEARHRQRVDSAPTESEAPRRRKRASDAKIESALAARTVELLLRPPESKTESLLQSELAPQLNASRRAAHAERATSDNVNPKDFNILIIDDDIASCEQAAEALSEYTVEKVHDGVSGLAKLISFKPDLVILDVDLPVVDGFKVLAHIRSNLNMPVIIISGTRIRASDRVMAAELGADYFLTKPFIVKELQQKARQLIARYRNIDSWIITVRAAGERATAESSSPAIPGHIFEPAIMSIGSGSDQFTPYDKFAAEVERRVRTGLANGSPFSIVGCRLRHMTSNGGRDVLRLFEIVSTLVRDTDLISTNPRNDLVILLTDADASGARAFIRRLNERVMVEMNEEPSLWLRSFPELEETGETKPAPKNETNGHRRASDLRR